MYCAVTVSFNTVSVSPTASPESLVQVTVVKLGCNVLHDGGEREREEGERGKKEVKVQIREEISNFVHEWVKCY